MYGQIFSINHHYSSLLRSPKGLSCDFEWIRKTWNVTGNDCLGLEERVEFAGDYLSHDCSLRVREAASLDTGLWTQLLCLTQRLPGRWYRLKR